MQEYCHQHFEGSPKISFQGLGVHYGKDVDMVIIPQSSGGVVFHRVDLPKNNKIEAIYSNVSATNLNTTISNGNVSVATIEHLLAGFFAVGLKHAVVLIDGPEIPLMDGGSSDFIFGLECIAIPKQKAENFYLQKEIKVELNSSWIVARPCDYLKIKCEVEFSHPMIGNQTIVFNERTSSFKEEFSHAKTFGHLETIKKMQQTQGICLGGDMFSAVVFDDTKIISPSFSYNADDFAKHKLLDFIGDISLSPFNIKAEFECFRPSHKINNLLISKIFESINN